MGKNNQLGYWIILMMVFGVGLYYLNEYTNIFSTVVFEDYVDYDNRLNPTWQYEDNYVDSSSLIKTYSDDLWDITLSKQAYNTRCGSPQVSGLPSVDFIDSNMVLKGSYGTCEGGIQVQGTTLIETKKDLRGNDLKISLEVYGCYVSPSGGYRGGSSSMIIGNENIPISNVCELHQSKDIKDTTIEMYSSKLDSNIADIYINGVFDRTANFSMLDNVGVSLSAQGPKTITINQFGFKIPFNCQQSPEELLGFETFAGPRSLSLYDLRYNPTKFCLDHPMIITRESEQGSTTTAEVYNKLRQGEVLQIPEGDTWTFFYIFYNDGSLPAVCSEGSFDIERNKCTNLTGIAYFCSEGTFDPSLGSCVVTPDIKPVCPYGRLDIAQDRCIYNPPIHAVCEVGDYNSVTGKCEYFIDNDIICEQGYKYNNLTEMCESYPEAVIVCEPTFSFNPITSLCEKSVPTKYLCEGDWDSVTKICTKTVVPNIDYVCPDDSYLFQDSRGMYSCIYEPDLTPECNIGDYDKSLDKCVYTPDEDIDCGDDYYDSVKDICIHEPDNEMYCPQGYFDKDKNACVVTPDLKYLCLNGELSSDKQSCVITPRVRIVCPSNSSYDIDSETCIYDVDIECPEGSVYSLVQDKCIKTPDEVILCPYGSDYKDGKCLKEIKISDLIGLEDIKIFGFKVGIGAFVLGVFLTLIILFFILSRKR